MTTSPKTREEYDLMKLYLYCPPVLGGRAKRGGEYKHTAHGKYYNLEGVLNDITCYLRTMKQNIE